MRVLPQAKLTMACPACCAHRGPCCASPGSPLDPTPVPLVMFERINLYAPLSLPNVWVRYNLAAEKKMA